MHHPSANNIACERRINSNGGGVSVAGPRARIPRKFESARRGGKGGLALVIVSLPEHDIDVIFFTGRDVARRGEEGEKRTENFNECICHIARAWNRQAGDESGETRIESSRCGCRTTDASTIPKNHRGKSHAQPVGTRIRARTRPSNGFCEPSLRKTRNSLVRNARADKRKSKARPSTDAETKPRARQRTETDRERGGGLSRGVFTEGGQHGKEQK